VKTFGSLFAGIGGFDLGFERAGMECRWQVEIDPYCQRVLAKHWPNVRRWDDVRTWPQPDTERVEVICGGFPCQDISSAGERVGIEGTRSSLWFEYARIIRVLRPSYIVVENVAALLVRGMDRVLGDLAACGYDAEWQCLPASAFGAHHQRDRIWIVAYPECDRRQQGPQVFRGWESELSTCGQDMAHANSEQTVGTPESWTQRHPWKPEPDVGRVANGIPSRVDRLRGLGNAVVPQIAEWIGRRILESTKEPTP
jgi:DNA (cytosine-5)-methyltransferase 1